MRSVEWVTLAIDTVIAAVLLAILTQVWRWVARRRRERRPTHPPNEF